jgi:hypothetical protein
MSKFIAKIQSFTDVITNSSSSVFVMQEFNAEYYNDLEKASDCVSIEPIDILWIKQHSYEFEMICAVAALNKSEVSEYVEGRWGGYWEDPDPEAWDSFVELHKEHLCETFEGMYFVEIEDHFEDAWDVMQDASSDALWSENRH